VLCLAASSAAAATGDQSTSPRSPSQAIGGGRPVPTITVKRCPPGYEFVVRANGRRGCAKDIVPPNE